MTDWRGDLLKIGIIPDDMPDQTNFVLFNLDELANHMIKELNRAREEGRKELIKEIRESVKENIKIDDTEEKHIKIDTDIVKILNDKEITKMFLDGEEGEDIDWDCYGGWGWYS